MNNYSGHHGGNWGWGNTSSQNYQNSFSDTNGTSQYSYQCDNNWNTPFIFKLQKQTDSNVITDDQDRRIISRESLFQDPNTFKFITSPRVEINKQNKCQILKKNGIQNNNEGSAQHPDVKYKPGFDWTKTSWQKASTARDTSPDRITYPELIRRMKKHKQILMQKLSKTAEPLKMSKVENMMLKMGWKGGPLGKSGDGILEPLEPNNDYSCRSGFGQMEYVKPNKKSQKQQYSSKPVMKLKSKGQKEIYKTNALNHILDFVRNDLEIEIKFDNKLRPIERKYIHHIVNEVINGKGEDDEFDMEFENSHQMDLLEEIKKCNIFVLGTQSEGKQSKRCLCLYKEAAEHMFLITPEDLREDENENDKSNEVIDLIEEKEKVAKEKTAAEAAKNKNEKSDESKDNDMEVESKNLSVQYQDENENDKSNEVIDLIEEEEKEAEEAAVEETAENETENSDESKDNDMEVESKNLSVQYQDENENDKSNEVIDLIEEEEKEAEEGAVEVAAENEPEKSDETKDNNVEVESKNLSHNNASNKSNDSEKSTDDVIEKFKRHCSLVENSVKINPEILKRLVEYFIEFLQTQDYMEFRFLGAYDINEVNTINYFLSNYYDLIDLLQNKEKVLEDLEKSGYYVQCMEDDNGSILFLKSVCTRKY